MRGAEVSDRLSRRALRIVELCAWLVPVDRRADWRRQWAADLEAQAGFLRFHPA